MVSTVPKYFGSRMLRKYKVRANITPPTAEVSCMYLLFGSFGEPKYFRRVTAYLLLGASFQLSLILTFSVALLPSRPQYQSMIRKTNSQLFSGVGTMEMPSLHLANTAAGSKKTS
ncbi:hypothetical protein BDR05DRAFT_1011309 [Suillus weaverae]|nr:hypothetical protein BDR05DRAFT_1011309 [Suillus weaverae]